MSDRRHNIRLWGPWQVQATPACGKLPLYESRLNFKSLETEVESPWSDDFASDFAGKLTLSRKFNRPTGLAFGQKVVLQVELFDPRQSGSVVLHQSQDLGWATIATLQELTLDLVEGFNQVEFQFEISSGGLVDFRLPPFRTMQIGIEE